MNLMFSLSKNRSKDFVGKKLQFTLEIFDASPGKRGRISRLPLMLTVLLCPVGLKFLCGRAQALCPPWSFLCQMLTALPLNLCPLSRPGGLDCIVSRTYALQAYPEYLAFFLALPASRPGLLPSLPLLTLSSSSLPSPSPSSSPSLACASV
jgi:hypothetical protein